MTNPEKMDIASRERWRRGVDVWLPPNAVSGTGNKKRKRKGEKSGKKKKKRKKGGKKKENKKKELLL